MNEAAYTEGTFDHPLIRAFDGQFLSFINIDDADALGPSTETPDKRKELRRAHVLDQASADGKTFDPIYTRRYRINFLAHEITHALTIGSNAQPLRRDQRARWEAAGYISELENDFLYARFVHGGLLAVYQFARLGRRHRSEDRNSTPRRSMRDPNLSSPWPNLHVPLQKRAQEKTSATADF